eukprot:443-Amphidinium_carterae.1
MASSCCILERCYTRAAKVSIPTQINHTVSIHATLHRSGHVNSMHRRPSAYIHLKGTMVDQFHVQGSMEGNGTSAPKFARHSIIPLAEC